MICLLVPVIYPSPASADTLTLRPNDVGDYTVISSQEPPSGAHWDKVDEAAPDTTTYVFTSNNTQQKDAYKLEDTSQTGTINSVTVYFRFRRSSTQGSSAAYCQPFLRLGTSETAGTEQALNSTTWTNYNQTLARPGGGSWSWTDIDNLQVCIGLRDTGTGSRAARCTQVYVVVYYTPIATLSVDISGNLSFCPGTSDNLTAVASGGVPPYSYLWSTGATTQSIEITDPGTYSVTVSDSTACSSTIVSDNNTIVTFGNGSIPHNALLAWVHPNWWDPIIGLDYTFDYYTDNTTRWIWETYQVVNPEPGDVVYFQRSFNIPGTPIGATLHVTCDNGYEAWLNGNFLGWAQLTDYGGIPWEESDLTDNWTASNGWQSVETYVVPATLLIQGDNVLEIRAANEQNTGGTVTSNPGAIIYDLIYEYNCAASDSVDVTWNPTPTANFTAVPLSGTAPLTVQFTDTSIGATSWAWDFNDDGTTDNTTQNPSYQYSSPGTYTVTLIVTNEYGCSDDEIKPAYITVNEPPTAPTVNSIEIYDTQDCGGPAVTFMDPQDTYYAKVSITTNGEQLSGLQTVQATLFYVSDNSTPPAPGIADAQTCAILSRTVGGTISDWTIQPSDNTTWAIVPGSCSEPIDLNATSGDWIFAFIPGRVATESIQPAHWDAQGKATNNSSQTGDSYVRDKAMNWYGEITVNTASVNWGDVPLGLTSDNTTYNPKTVSIKYVANGDYYENVRSEDWSGSGETVILSTGDPPALPGRFALKADDTDILGAEISVTGSYNYTNDTRGLTTEDGVTIATNSLWLSLSATGVAPVTYSGTIYYQIAER